MADRRPLGPDNWLTVAELARELKMSPATVRDLCSERGILRKFAGSARVKVGDLALIDDDTWDAQNTTTSKAPSPRKRRVSLEDVRRS